MLYVAKMSYTMIPVETIFSENMRTSINGNKHLELYLMLSPEGASFPALKTEQPEYYCWGEMNVGKENSGGKDDRGMIVYPYDKIEVRDCHISVSRGLEKVLQTMWLMQDFSEEKVEERKLRMQNWGFPDEMMAATSNERNISSYTSSNRKRKEHQKK